MFLLMKGNEELADEKERFEPQKCMKDQEGNFTMISNVQMDVITRVAQETKSR